MRWSGLAITDASTLRRDEIIYDKAKRLHRIVTSRQKTGTHVSVPLPDDVAREILAVLNGNPVYVFWSGNGKERSAVTNWQHDLRALFRDAGIKSEGNMLSHRLRDTFAVGLLEKGVGIEEVSKLLGNSIKIAEKHYAQWVKTRQDRLDSLVTATWEKKARQ
jgi:integrase/recombinase XerD